MLEKTLYKTSFGYSAECTEEQMKQIQKFFPEAAFKSLADFGISSCSQKEDKYKSWSKEDFKNLQQKEYAEYLKLEIKPFKTYFFGHDEYIDLEEFLRVCTIPINIESRKVIKFTDSTQQFSILEYQNIFKILERLSHQLDSRESFNTHCNVHIAGHHLMNINELMLCEDYCTDSLQERLNQKWQIISCCVQDNRRPDYVLGRYNPDYKAISKAKRG